MNWVEVMGKDFIFLGICEKAHKGLFGDHNLIGLTTNLFVYLVPTNLQGKFIVLAINSQEVTGRYDFSICDKNGTVRGTFNISFETCIDNTRFLDDMNLIIKKYHGWDIFFVPIDYELLVLSPGDFSIRMNSPREELLGSFSLLLAEAPPLTDERIAAIKSDPNCVSTVKAVLMCKECSSQLQVYCALDRHTYNIKDHIWYEDLPDYFECSCKKTSFDLRSIKRNFHVYLGQNTTNTDASVQFHCLYDKNSLVKLRENYLRLLFSQPTEEMVHQFILKNPMLLQQFSAVRIISKPPILAKFKADFALVTSNRELVLIEIEKTSTKLMRQNGHRHAELTHAFEQVNDWLQVILEYKSAVLSQLGIKSEDINNIRGVVIAGLENSYDMAKIRRLKMNVNDRNIAFYTYTDLLFALDSLIEKFARLN